MSAFLLLADASGSITTAKLWLTAWEPEWSINLGSAALTGAYFWGVPANAWRRAFFLTGIAVLLLSLESPLDALGDSYLFSAHMAQHLLLILIVPPLLLLGVPEDAARQWLAHPTVAVIESILGRPWIAWTAAIATMTLWHLPFLYNLALAHDPIHILQHLSFLVTATMFWWPVLCPLSEKRLPIGPAILYLFAAAAENSILGIVITFMQVGHYPAYLHPDDDLHALALIRNGWGLSPEADQRLGGLLMWIPGCSVYFLGILGLLAHWFSAPESELEPERSQATALTLDHGATR